MVVVLMVIMLVPITLMMVVMAVVMFAVPVAIMFDDDLPLMPHATIQHRQWPEDKSTQATCKKYASQHRLLLFHIDTLEHARFVPQRIILTFSTNIRSGRRGKMLTSG
jgi:hypothetical protein